MNLKLMKLSTKDVINMYVWTSSLNYKIKDFIKLHEEDEELSIILDDIYTTNNEFIEFLDQLNRFSTTKELESSVSFNTFNYHVYTLHQKIKQYKDILDFLFIFNYEVLESYVME